MMSEMWLVGRVGQAPEVKDVGGKKVLKFSVATSRGKKNADGSWQDITDWHSCQYWVQSVPANLTKGALVALSGRLESWKTADKSGWQVVVQSLRVLQKSADSQAAGGVQATDYYQPAAALTDKGFGDVTVVPMGAGDDLPFPRAATDSDDLPF